MSTDRQETSTTPSSPPVQTDAPEPSCNEELYAGHFSKAGGAQVWLVWLRRLLFGAGQIANDQLLRQFFALLDARMRALYIAAEPSAPQDARLAEVKMCLQPPYNWRKAYHIELLLVELHGPEIIDAEIARRVEEADHAGIPRAAFYRQSQGESLSLTGKRKLLGDLVDDLQWFYTQRFLRREYAQGRRLG